jgi:hypothetical protein
MGQRVGRGMRDRQTERERERDSVKNDLKRKTTFKGKTIRCTSDFVIEIIV